MQYNTSLNRKMQYFVDRMAVVIVCEDHEDHDECIRSVRMYMKRFPEDHIYVVDCTSERDSIYTLQDVLDENDLHTVNYVQGGSNHVGLQEALQKMYSNELMHYEHVMLANPMRMKHAVPATKRPSVSSISSDTTSEMSSSTTASGKSHVSQ